MSKVLRIDNGDYKLKVQSNGNIYLETDDTRGREHGTVDVSGDLTVGGDLIVGSEYDDLSGLIVSNEAVLRYLSYNPTRYENGLKIYSKYETQYDTESVAGTNVYFINSLSESDEFVSRRKALAYSMIF